MLKPRSLQAEVPKHFNAPNMILLSSARPKEGKTKFAVGLIEHFKKEGHIVYGLKISCDFFSGDDKYCIINEESFKVSLEKETLGSSDSNRMLKAGANEVFIVNTLNEKALNEAFHYVNRLANKEVLWVCESMDLRTIVKPSVFLYFQSKGLPRSKDGYLRQIADKIVYFDGEHFDYSPEMIKLVDHKLRAD